VSTRTSQASENGPLQRALRTCMTDAKVFARSVVSGMLRPAGFDLIRLHRMPRETFLGLGQLPIRTILDVGANRGQFAREALHFFPEARLVCFEPLDAAASALRAWAQTVPQDITVVQTALGDTDGVVKMKVHLDWEPSSSLLETTDAAIQLYPYQERQSAVEATLTTLDGFLARLTMKLDPDVLVKIDAQGFDDRVVRGAGETLRKARACIVEVNLDALYQDQGTFKDMFLLMDGLGYSYRGNLDQSYAPDGHVAFIDAVFVR
jgi:FkbM family methyltransferase